MANILWSTLNAREAVKKNAEKISGLDVHLEKLEKQLNVKCREIPFTITDLWMFYKL